MRGGYLQGCAIGGVVHLAEKMHPIRIDRVLTQQLGTPVGGILGFAAIAHIIATNNYHLAGGVRRQQARQGPHELMKAPIRLQITRHVGHHRVAGLQLLAIG
ncbi:hypothetical protein D3C84_848350 [compost metagenome]